MVVGLWPGHSPDPVLGYPFRPTTNTTTNSLALETSNSKYHFGETPESATRTHHENSSSNAYNGTLSPTGKHAAGDGYLCWNVDILGTADGLDALGKCQEPARLRISPVSREHHGRLPDHSVASTLL